MKQLALFALLICTAGGATAGPRHFLRTHIDLLATDTAVAFAVNADAASTVHCFHTPGCGLVETNPLAGSPRPSNIRIYFGANAIAAGTMLGLHLLYHFFPEDRHTLLFLAAPVVLGEGIVTRDNVRLMQSQ